MPPFDPSHQVAASVQASQSQTGQAEVPPTGQPQVQWQQVQHNILGEGPTESIDIVENVSKKESIVLHCSIEKREPGSSPAGVEIPIKIRIINDSSKVIKHISISVAKSTAAEREKAAQKNKKFKQKHIPRFEGTEEVLTLNGKFPLGRGLFDGVVTYKLPPCREGTYSDHSCELVLEFPKKKGEIRAFLPITL